MDGPPMAPSGRSTACQTTSTTPLAFIFTNGYATNNPDDVTRRAETRSVTAEEAQQMLNTNKAFDAIQIEKADELFTDDSLHHGEQIITTRVL